MGEAAADRSEAWDNQLAELIRRVSTETRFWSGRFHTHSAFREIVRAGDTSLPGLIALLADEERDAEWAWWQLEAIWTIAETAGKPIDYPAEVKGHFDPVRELTLAWGYEQGYLAEATASG
jgi:hypothetical protein